MRGRGRDRSVHADVAHGRAEAAEVAFLVLVGAANDLSRVVFGDEYHKTTYIPRFSGAGGDSITGATFSTFFSTLNFMYRRGVAKGASRK